MTALRMAPNGNGNGNGNGRWTTGPLVRSLRAISILSFLALLAFVILAGRQDISIVALLAGGVLLQLGYDVLIRLPFIQTGKTKEDDPT